MMSNLHEIFTSCSWKQLCKILWQNMAVD